MSKYSLSFKLQVVKHYLSGREGQKATAKRFGIDLRVEFLLPHQVKNLTAYPVNRDGIATGYLVK